jgi:hypothetical protein
MAELKVPMRVDLRVAPLAERKDAVSVCRSVAAKGAMKVELKDEQKAVWSAR